jgi:hypothetical protein
MKKARLAVILAGLMALTLAAPAHARVLSYEIRKASFNGAHPNHVHLFGRIQCTGSHVIVRATVSQPSGKGSDVFSLPCPRPPYDFELTINADWGHFSMGDAKLTSKATSKPDNDSEPENKTIFLINENI